MPRGCLPAGRSVPLLVPCLSALIHSGAFSHTGPVGLGPRGQVHHRPALVGPRRHDESCRLAQLPGARRPRGLKPVSRRLPVVLAVVASLPRQRHHKPFRPTNSARRIITARRHGRHGAARQAARRGRAAGPLPAVFRGDWGACSVIPPPRHRRRNCVTHRVMPGPAS